MKTIEVSGLYEGLDDEIESRVHALEIDGCEWHSSGFFDGGRHHDWSCVDQAAADRLMGALRDLGLHVDTYEYDEDAVVV